MSLLKGDDFRTVFVEAAKVNTNVLVAAQVGASIGVNNNTVRVPITGSLNLASFSGAQPQNFGSIVGTFTGLDVKGADGYPGQIVSFASVVTSSVTSFPISHLAPLDSVALRLVPVSGISGSSVAGQLLCVAPGSWHLLSAVGTITQP
jgi:hypothetical protein